jgi:hypothetical protein
MKIGAFIVVIGWVKVHYCQYYVRMMLTCCNSTFRMLILCLLSILFLISRRKKILSIHSHISVYLLLKLFSDYSWFLFSLMPKFAWWPLLETLAISRSSRQTKDPREASVVNVAFFDDLFCLSLFWDLILKSVFKNLLTSILYSSVSVQCILFVYWLNNAYQSPSCCYSGRLKVVNCHVPWFHDSGKWSATNLTSCLDNRVKSEICKIIKS